jgi:hypothetical protein
LGEGEVEGVLVGPAGVDRWSEGGGEALMPRWELRLDDGRVIDVQEAAPTLVNPPEGPRD